MGSHRRGRCCSSPARQSPSGHSPTPSPCLRSTGTSFRGYTTGTSRTVLEAAFPPKRFTPAGHDPQQEYDATAAYLNTFSTRTIRNAFWSANNYALPKSPARIDTTIIYWYDDDEQKERKRDMQFMQGYFPQIRIRSIPQMARGAGNGASGAVLPNCGSIPASIKGAQPQDFLLVSAA